VIVRASRAASCLLMVAVAITLASCGGTSTTAGGRLTTLVSGWEQFFKIDWKVDTSKGRPIVWGYVSNESGMTAAKMRLLAEGLDQSGGILFQELAWVPFTLTPGTRSYFEVPLPREAPTYRVSVFSFDWIQSDDIRRRFP
jgi:hypothetical protein